jgi:hypothetical protein
VFRKRGFARRGALLVACAVCATLAALAGTAGAATQVTLGSTSGTPNGNICAATIRCTYTPFVRAQPVPQAYPLTVPFDGTVTSFSVNAGSAGGTVWLRVLRPVNAGNGVFTGAGTSSPLTLHTGINTFTVSLPAKAGDVVALDNDSSALLFDTSSALIAEAWSPAVADGVTAGANASRLNTGLLLSATVTATPPSITGLSQSHGRWRVGGKLARLAAAATPPVGTTFGFTLNQASNVRFGFAQLLPGRNVNGRCVAQTAANRTRPACTRSVGRGALLFSASAGAHKLFFQGRLSRTRKLSPGVYTLTITATNPQGTASRTTRSFTIVPG